MFNADGYGIFGTAIAAVIASTVLLWSSAQISAVLDGHGWMSTSITQAPEIASQTVRHGFDLTEAWPEDTRAQLGSIGFIWGFFAFQMLFVAVVAYEGVMFWLRNTPAAREHRKWVASEMETKPRSEPFTGAALPAKSVREVGGAGVSHLALQPGTDAPPGSVSVVAPGGAETAGLVVRAIAGHVGPALVCSTTPDLLALTGNGRAAAGPIWVFDPCDVTGSSAVIPWSPLMEIHDYAGAVRASSWLLDSVDPNPPAPGNGASVATSATGESEITMLSGAAAAEVGVKLLAPMLFAASQMGLDMVQVVRWIERRGIDSVRIALRDLGDEHAQAAWAATCGRTPDDLRSSFASAERLLDGYALPQLKSPRSFAGVHPQAPLGAPMSVDPDGSRGVPPLDTMLDVGTLYVVAPVLPHPAPAVVVRTFVSAVAATAAARSAAGGPATRPTVLVVLDDADQLAAPDGLERSVLRFPASDVIVCSVWREGLHLPRSPAMANLV
jgi:hypothetical protein